MKYIKLFESFNPDMEEIKLECEDILLPLKDDGIAIRVFTFVDVDSKIQKIMISIGNYENITIGNSGFDGYILALERSFSLDKYKNDIEHLFSYLSDKGFKFSTPSTTFLSDYDGEMEEELYNNFFMKIKKMVSSEKQFWNIITKKCVYSEIEFEKK